MPVIHLPKTELTPQLRADSVSAFNIIRERGQLPPHSNYAFEQGPGGAWGVAIWCGDRRHPEGGVVWTPCADLIVAAGPLGLVRGTAE